MPLTLLIVLACADKAPEDYAPPEDTSPVEGFGDLALRMQIDDDYGDAVLADGESLVGTFRGSLYLSEQVTGAGPDEAGPHPPGPEVVGDVRVTLEEYSFDFLRTVLSVTCGAAMVSYCLWAFDTKELAGTSWPFYELSIVPMVTALLRYTLVVEQGHGSAPEEIFLQDRTLQVLGLVWLVVFGLGVYV